MSEFKKFKRSAVAEMREVTEIDIKVFEKSSCIPSNMYPSLTEKNTKVSISDKDLSNGSPKIGDWIARNLDDHNDQWLVAADYKKDNFEEILETSPKEKKSDKDFQGLLYVGKGTFGMAIEAVKQGGKVARVGWNGKDMFVYYVPAAEYAPTTDVGFTIANFRGNVKYRAYLALKTAQDDVATWAPSGSDALAEDWIIVK